MFGSINMWLGAGAGAALALVLGYAYNGLIDNPAVEREARAAALAQAQINTYKAISEVRNEADKARALLRYCRDTGRVYDFSAGECR